MRHSTTTVLGGIAGLVLVAGAVQPAAARPVTAAADAPDTFTNPVSQGFADTFADPAVMRGKDGWWYAVGTTDPLREGEGTRHLVPTARSADLVDWEYTGDAFTEDTLPSWADPDPEAGASIWAPDLRYVDGEYRLYYVVTETTLTPGRGDGAIGVATAPSPTGPWIDSGAPVVGPRPGASGSPDDFLWTFDPTHVRDDDGRQYLFYGSYYGGIWTVPLDATGTRADGEPVRVTIDNKYEGAYVVQHDGWWYLFVSSANCCAGPATGYSVHVGRSRELTGPYVDHQGVPLDQSRAGGTPVLAPNGNRWIGTGHNAVVTDLAGQDWIVYHAIDRADPYLDGDGGINERPMLMDRLDWVDGWPTARGGAWASDSPQPAPVASGARTVTGFDDGAGRGWRADRGWTFTGGAAVSGEGTSRIVKTVSGLDGVRAEADVSVAGAGAGLTVGLRGGGSVRAVVDATGTLRLSLWDRRGPTTTVATGTPGAAADVDAADWHSLVLVVADGVATAELSDARLGDPLATARLDLAATQRGGQPFGRSGAIATGAGARIDNLSVAAVAAPGQAVPPEPLGELDITRSDEFDGPLDERWTPLRAPQVRVEGGELRWPVQNADLTGPGGSAALLLQNPPDGDWTVETSVDVSQLGVDEIRNYQQGGIVVYVDDDQWVRLSTVAIWNTRQNEFGHELPWATGPIFGGTIVGPPGERSWLRVTHRTDPGTGERLLGSATSNDGVTWVTGGTWTLPADSSPRVGLFSGGAPSDAVPPSTELGFDYLRWYVP